MSIVTGIQTGIQAEIRTGINGYWSPPVLSWRTQDNWLSATGLTLAHLLLCEDAATPLTDEIGAADLTVNGGTLQATTQWPGVVAFANEGAGEFAYADVFDDDGATSRAHIALVQLGATSSNGILGRNTNATSPGYRAYVAATTGYLRWRHRDSGGTNAEAEIAVDHRGYVGPLAFVTDWDAGLGRVHSTLGSGTVDISSLLSISSTSVFDLGIARGTANGVSGNRIIRYAHATGANAEGVDWAAVTHEIGQGISQ